MGFDGFLNIHTEQEFTKQGYYQFSSNIQGITPKLLNSDRELRKIID